MRLSGEVGLGFVQFVRVRFRSKYGCAGACNNVFWSQSGQRPEGVERGERAFSILKINLPILTEMAKGDTPVPRSGAKPVSDARTALFIISTTAVYHRLDDGSRLIAYERKHWILVVDAQSSIESGSPN